MDTGTGWMEADDRLLEVEGRLLEVEDKLLEVEGSLLEADGKLLAVEGRLPDAVGKELEVVVGRQLEVRPELLGARLVEVEGGVLEAAGRLARPFSGKLLEADGGILLAEEEGGRLAVAAGAVAKQEEGWLPAARMLADEGWLLDAGKDVERGSSVGTPEIMFTTCTQCTHKIKGSFPHEFSCLSVVGKNTREHHVQNL